ncbi:MAG: NAD(P)/FAD-dependent oxidoreductase [Myxococcota bacterium]
MADGNARKSNPHAGAKIQDDDATIAAMLEDVSIPTLALSMVHMTGDPGWIRGPIRPQGLFLNEIQGFMPEEQKATLRKQALEAIIAFRDGGCVLPPPPSEELIQEMMAWLVCAPVPGEYVPMMLEEMELDGSDSRAVVTTSPAEARSALRVLVIGAGESGVLAGIRLQQAGIPFTIIEKNAGVGGTWWENSYPGCRVDVGNHFYCYSFEPSDHWTEYFAQQPEIQAYFENVARRHDLMKNIRFETEVVEAAWDEAAGVWHVKVKTRSGAVETLDARAVITAVGQLNRPQYPDIPGLEKFKGPMFHSARWDHSVDYAGKKVAVIGAGASGFQIVPTIAPEVDRLAVFQRTAQWMFPNPNYHAKIPAGMTWAIRHLPFFGRWYRFLLFWPGTDGSLASARIDPSWPHQERSVNQMNDFARQMFTDWITSQVGDDPELLAKVIPDYPATGKRTLQDNGSWLGALKRDNVELVREGIHHVDETGIVTESGARYEADIIVLATGFMMAKVLFPMEFRGRGGRSLNEFWSDRPSAYLGITVPGFPNLFMMYGPSTHLNHGGSLIFHSECQMRYIGAALDLLAGSGKKSMEPRPELYDAYHAKHQAEIKQLVWSSPAVKHTHFRNAAGEIHTVSPFRLVDYWSWTRTVAPEDFVFG